MANSSKTKDMAQLALLIAIQIILVISPLGFIPLGVTRATTVHVPVIIGALVLGIKPGMILGLVFGLSSILVNTFTPTITSFVFSPFYSLGEFGGNIWSIVIAIVPRVMIAVVSYLFFKFLSKLIKQPLVVAAISGIAGSLTNTFLVLGGIYLFFGENYAAVKGIPYSELMMFLAGVISVNGILEAAVAAVLVAIISLPLLKINNKI